MKVSAAEPFQIIYSLLRHEYLGYLFESFVIHVDTKGQLTLQHQNIASRNAVEFSDGLDQTDLELIEITDSIQPDAIAQRFSKRKIKGNEFFLKIYDKEDGNQEIQEEIGDFLEKKRSIALDLLTRNKRLFEMGSDGEPAWKEIEIIANGASVLFHFRKNEDNTHYFPTIKHDGVKVFFQYKGAYLICKDPAWMVLNHKLYHFSQHVEGQKLAPFLNKKFILIPKDLEATYYEKFVAPLVASYKVFAKGFQIQNVEKEPNPIVSIADIANPDGQLSLNTHIDAANSASKILFLLKFRYARFVVSSTSASAVAVELQQHDGLYTFFRIKRDLFRELKFLKQLEKTGLDMQQARIVLDKPEAFSWLNHNRSKLEKVGFSFTQETGDNKKFFLGQPEIDVEIRENIDWFDVHATIRFGEFVIPFRLIRKAILRRQSEIRLPDGSYGIIPKDWFDQYGDFLAFVEDESAQSMKLKKHHLALIQDLNSGALARVTMDGKLAQLNHFESIEIIETPRKFKGKLRPYQEAGYSWLRFLSEFKFGGCLADDMGLGKTVQTLALLQAEKERKVSNASLLIMPTSLIYNWEKEAKKFTPELKVVSYVGTQRDKDVAHFDGYDLVLTSYGIARLDIEILRQYYFNYVILDESQAIKNPSSHTAKAVKKLKSKLRLILTGTPLENTTLDLWSQMAFINPGLLGGQSFFVNEFLKPIEHNNDPDKIKKLFSMIKPFVLRRNKSQVLKELPDKVENIHYSSMTTMQEKHYMEVKNKYRNEILKKIEKEGINKSKMTVLQGLTKLRQLANHPRLVVADYGGDSGKMGDVLQMISSAIAEKHKTLIFSQFVKHLSLFREYLDDQEVPYAYLDGSTKDRRTQVERFQNDPDVPLFLISLKAGGLGLNLTKADYVFILDPWWNPAVEEQAVDRAHRIGQEKTVFKYKFITRDSVEEKILLLQEHKKQMVEGIIPTEKGILKSLTRDDIELLLD